LYRLTVIRFHLSAALILPYFKKTSPPMMEDSKDFPPGKIWRSVREH
jgi:hypothetical protein